MTTIGSRRAWALSLVVAVGGLTACSGGGTPAPGASGNASAGTTTSTITFWDPYPQHKDGSDWDKHVKACAPSGSTITRTSLPQTDLFNQLTTAVKEGKAPDIAVLDNPMMPEAVSASLLATDKQAGIDASGVDANLLGPGVLNGQTYGVPFGSNALGLYYNKKVMDAAGVDPTQIHDWAGLDAAIAKVVAAGSKGITFSGVAGEEGVFQFEPWLWGAGAKLNAIGSPEAVSAGQLISDWIGKGWAPRSAVTDNQSASWDLFLTGQYGFAENGSWFASAAAANKDFSVGMIPIPGKTTPVAPVPTGGEFAVAPIQTTDASNHYANAKAVISCLVSGDAAKTTSELLGYLSAKPDVRAAQVAANDTWKPWVSIIEGAQGRTTELGAGYVNASAQISQAIQGALNAAGDAAGVQSAFKDAAGS
jgi:multiple sugar transport system substrate-binding protein